MKHPSFFVLTFILFWTTSIQAEIDTSVGTPHWKSNDNLNYFFVNGTPDIAGDGEQAAIKKGLNIWAPFVRMTFTEVNNADDADVVIEFLSPGDARHQSAFGNDNPFRNSQAVGDKGFIYFDETEKWTDQPRNKHNTPYNVTAITAHEFGHVLGLPNNPGWPGMMTAPAPQSDRRFLSQGDIDWVYTHYSKPHRKFGGPNLRLKNFGYQAGGWRIQKHPRMMADVNGDGRSDIIGFGAAGVFVSLTNVFGPLPAVQVIRGFAYSSGWRVGRHPRMMADVNGDGKADIVGFGGAGVYVSLAQPTSPGSQTAKFSTPAFWIGHYGYNDGWRMTEHPRMLEDVNGDGKADIVGFDNSGVYVSLSTGSSFSPASLWTSHFGYDAGNWRVDKHPRMMADVNGDGKADILGFDNNGVYVSTSTGTGFTNPSLWVRGFGQNDDWRDGQNPRMMADVNGDGLDDIVGFANNGVYVSVSRGSSFKPSSLWVKDYGYWLNDDGFSVNPGGWSRVRNPRIMVDMNNDGKADVVGFGDSGVFISFSTGTSFTPPKLEVRGLGYHVGGWTETFYPRLVADIDNSRIPDFIGFGEYGVSISGAK